jgi:hypothetical protein
VVVEVGVDLDVDSLEEEDDSGEEAFGAASEPAGLDSDGVAPSAGLLSEELLAAFGA